MSAFTKQFALLRETADMAMGTLRGIVKKTELPAFSNPRAGGIIAMGVTYNGARIALAERARELASLRVLGFSVHEIAIILLGEQAVLVALGIPAGWGLGILYSGLWMRALNGEAYRMPMVFSGSTFVLSAAVVCAMAVLAGLMVRRRLSHLDLVAVLKSRE